MISIRFKLLWVIIALVGAYLVVNQASAYTSPSSNAMSFVDADPGFISCSALAPDLVECNDILNNFTTLGTEITVAGSGANSGTTFTVIGVNFDTGRTRLFVTPTPAFEIRGTYGGYTFDDGIVPPGPTNTTWGDNGIWGGDVSTQDVKDTLSASVQATGTNLWPMLVFIGVAIAFTIFGYVVLSIQRSNRPKIARKRSKTFDPVQFNRKADELQEFYSKTGGADPVVVESIKRSIK